MSTHDTKGRPWAKLSELKEGDKVKIGAGFNCMKNGEIKEVKRSRDGSLIVNCDSEGGHWLAGQTENEINGDSLIGIYKL